MSSVYDGDDFTDRVEGAAVILAITVNPNDNGLLTETALHRKAGTEEQFPDCLLADLLRDVADKVVLEHHGIDVDEHPDARLSFTSPSGGVRFTTDPCRDPAVMADELDGIAEAMKQVALALRIRRSQEVN